MSCRAFPGSSGCDEQSVPEVPTILSVVQDPETLQVTAEIQDNSRNEQWMTLERSYTSKFNRGSVVGISVDEVDRENLPLNRDTGRTITIVDRGIFEGEVLVAGDEYSYSARAWNCYGWSEESNGINIIGLETD